MKKLSLLFALALLISLFSTAALASNIIVQNAVYQANGTPFTDLSTLGGTWTGGLGTITYKDTTAGTRSFDVFIDESLLTSTGLFFFDIGGVSGLLPLGMSFQIQCPEYTTDCFDAGTIMANTLANKLDNTNHVTDPNSPDDVSVAFGFNYTLDPGQIAAISIDVRQQQPTSGFYLSQTNALDQSSIYFVPSIDILTPGNEVPEPASMLLLATGSALAVLRSRLGKKK